MAEASFSTARSRRSIQFIVYFNSRFQVAPLIKKYHGKLVTMSFFVQITIHHGNHGIKQCINIVWSSNNVFHCLVPWLPWCMVIWTARQTQWQIYAFNTQTSLNLFTVTILTSIWQPKKLYRMPGWQPRKKVK